MSVSPLAGKPAEPSMLINVPRLVTAYYTGRPDPSVPAQRVVFGTSGHRGSSLDNAFSQAELGIFTPMWDVLLTHGDYYRHLADLSAYIQTQEQVSVLYTQPEA